MELFLGRVVGQGVGMVMVRVLWCGLLALAGASCEDRGAGGAPVVAPVGAEAYFPLELGGQTVRTQLALAPSESTRGLMYRDALPEDAGMLFIMAQPRQMTFHMPNVRFDLDVGFFTADGVLREVHQMFAGDTEITKSARTDLTLALEVNRGWFARHGVRPGATLDLDQVRAAVRARGFDPRALGLGDPEGAAD